MTTIRAHYDGKVIVPDEPVDLPLDRPLSLSVHVQALTREEYRKLPIEERLRRLDEVAGGISAPPLPQEMSRSDNFYDERE